MAKPAAPKRERLDDLPWEKIRAEYEGTEVSLRVLAARWGIKSENTLRRRRDAEGWGRNIPEITAQLVTAAVARQAKPAKATPSLRDAQPGVRTGGAAHTRAHTGPPAEHQEPRSPAARAPSTATVRATRAVQRDADDAADVSTALSLAAVHSEAIAEQVEIADAVLTLGRALLKRVTQYVATEDAAEREAAGAVLLLGEKDTLAGSLEATGKLMERAVAIKRRALGMDIVKGGAAGPVGEQRAPGDVERLLAELPVDELMRVREVALQASRLRPMAPLLEGKASETWD